MPVSRRAAKPLSCLYGGPFVDRPIWPSAQSRHDGERTRYDTNCYAFINRHTSSRWIRAQSGRELNIDQHDGEGESARGCSNAAIGDKVPERKSRSPSAKRPSNRARPVVRRACGMLGRPLQERSPRDRPRSLVGTVGWCGCPPYSKLRAHVRLFRHGSIRPAMKRP